MRIGFGMLTMVVTCGCGAFLSCRLARFLVVSSPTLSPTDPVPGGLLTRRPALAPGQGAKSVCYLSSCCLSSLCALLLILPRPLAHARPSACTLFTSGVWTRRRREKRGARGGGAGSMAARGATGAIHARGRGCAACSRRRVPVHQRRAGIAERPAAFSPSLPARPLPSTYLVASVLFGRASATRTRRTRQCVEVSHWGRRTFAWSE